MKLTIYITRAGDVEHSYMGNPRGYSTKPYIVECGSYEIVGGLLVLNTVGNCDLPFANKAQAVLAPGSSQSEMSFTCFWEDV